MDIAQLDAPLIAAFLDHLETAAATANDPQQPARSDPLAVRLPRAAAPRARRHDPDACSRSRPNAPRRNLLTYLTEPEVDALLAACDQTTWTGRRDHAMLALTIQTGLRISELIALNCQDITLGTGANVHTIGKGRKERRTPLIPPTERAQSLARRTRRRARRSAVPDPHRHAPQPRRDRAPPQSTSTAAANCPSLTAKHVTMHTLRHTAAMRLLLAGNDITVIALWLGHEQITTTQIYLHADMTHKQQAIDRTRPLNAKPGRYQPTDTLLAFLEAL